MEAFRSALICVICCSAISSSLGQECTSEGFFRHPEDCTRFYRCVDIWRIGRYISFAFSCPVGTVFDETISVCNYPYAAAPCDKPVTPKPEGNKNETEVTAQEGSEQSGGGSLGSTGSSESGTGPTESGGSVGVSAGSEGNTTVSESGVGAGESTGSGGNGADGGESILIEPVFSYQCKQEGFFPHDHDCQKFWLCESSGFELESELYLCPDEYLFDEGTQRCEEKSSVKCNKQPDLIRLKSEPKPVKLQPWQLESFFARFFVRSGVLDV